MVDRPYKANPDFFRKMAIGPEVREVLRQVAEKAKEIAVRISPDAPPLGEGYIASFDVAEETIVQWKGRYKGPRAAARLENTAAYAAAVEWGYKGRSDAETTSAHRVLGRTLDALGE